jgi:hypothetical protein
MHENTAITAVFPRLSFQGRPESEPVKIRACMNSCEDTYNLTVSCDLIETCNNVQFILRS